MLCFGFGIQVEEVDTYFYGVPIGFIFTNFLFTLQMYFPLRYTSAYWYIIRVPEDRWNLKIVQILVLD